MTPKHHQLTWRRGRGNGTPGVLLCLRMFVIGLVAVVCACVIATPIVNLPAVSDSSGTADGAWSPLAIRQERIKRMMEELEEKFVRLAGSLESAEPEHAKRLAAALRYSRQARLEDRLAGIAKLLSQDKLDAASEEQLKVIADLKHLTDMLTVEEDAAEKARKEIADLQAWSRQIKQILRSQILQRQETDNLTDKDRTLGDIDQQMGRLGELLRRQEELYKQTARQRIDSMGSMSRAAEAQRRVREDLESLTEQLKGGGAGPSEPKQDDPGSPAPATEALGQAVGHQKSAEEQLSVGKGRTARGSQREAIEQMSRAMESLKKERDRISRLPPEHLQTLAPEQDKLAEEAGSLAKQMAGASGQPGEETPPTGAGQPGKGAMEQSQKHMKQASAGLRGKQAKEAGESQTEAIEQLRKAQKEVEEKLAQLRKELQEQLLAGLEDRVRQMLARQSPMTQSTAELDARNRAGWTRAEHILCMDLADREGELGETAQQALNIVLEDATTIVFPQALEKVRDDLRAVAQLLKDKRTDSYTNQVQLEIEATLKDMLEALEQAQKQPPPAGPEGEPGEGGKQENPPLVPASAELKLLRTLQLQVNSSTESFDRLSKAGPVDGAMQARVRRIARLQSEVQELARKMAEHASE